MWQDWKRRVDEYTLRLTSAIPEELSGYRAASSQFTCAELVRHLAEDEIGTARHLVQIHGLGIESPKLILDGSVIKNRKGLKLVFQFTDTVIGSLRDSDLETAIGIPGTDKTVKTVHLIQSMIEHQTHHRGQLITYLRLNGLAPPARWSE